MPIIKTTNIQVDLESAGCPDCQRASCTRDEILAHDFNLTRVLPYNDAEIRVPESPYKDMNSIQGKEFYVISVTNKAYYDGLTSRSSLSPLETQDNSPCVDGFDYSKEYQLEYLPYMVTLPQCAKVGDYVNVKSEAFEGATGQLQTSTGHQITAEDIANGSALINVRIKSFRELDTLAGNVGFGETFITVERYTIGGMTVGLTTPVDHVLFWLSDVVIRPSGSLTQVSYNPDRSFMCEDDSLGSNLSSFRIPTTTNNQDEVSLHDIGLTQVKMSHTSRIESFGDGIENGHYKYIYVYRDVDENVDGFNNAVGCTVDSHSFYDMRDSRNNLILKDWDITIDISAENKHGTNGNAGLQQLSMEQPSMITDGVQMTDGSERKSSIKCPFDSQDDIVTIEYPTASSTYTGGNMITMHCKITSYAVDNDYMRARTKVWSYNTRTVDNELVPVHGRSDRQITWANL